MPDSKIVDAWALFAWLRDQQPAADKVKLILQAAAAGEVELLMSWINAGEVYYMLTRKHDARTAEQFLSRLPALPIRLLVPGEEDVIAAAKIKAARRVSYADAFAVALAVKENAAVITGDAEIRELADVVTVDWIGL
jgi:predicted nucleic acid-binding protein